MNPSPPRWTTLPPIPLRGVGTAMVESLDHYVCRQAWTTGISHLGISALIGRGVIRGGEHGERKFSGLSTYSEHIIFGLEQLTGVDDLRRGTLWVLKDVAGRLAFGRPSSQRRWCPECYMEWDDEGSWEPLIWAVEVFSLCPVHGCALESQCPACGAHQFANTSVIGRRICAKCKRALGSAGRRPAGSKFRDWVNRQVSDVIELCATPGQAPVRADSYSIYMESLVEQSKYRSKVPLILKDHIKNTGHNGGLFRPSIRTMINMCALQGVAVREMLLNPEEASSATLLDLWSDYSVLPYGAGSYGSRVEIVCWLLRKLLAKCKGFYLPPMEHALAETGLNRACLREMNVDLYESYESLYRSQASWAMTYRLADAFRTALLHLPTAEPNRLTRNLYWSLPNKVAPIAHLSSEEVAPACWSAVLYARLVLMAKKRVGNVSLDAMEDPPWLRIATD